MNINHTADWAGLEARVGLRVGAALSEMGQQTPHDISERLRVAREQALERARSRRLALNHQSAPAVVVFNNAGAAVLGTAPRWWTPLVSALPLLMLVLGLVLIDDWNDRAQILAAAEVDAALLADDLPPDAYSDPGFIEFLKSPEN